MSGDFSRVMAHLEDGIHAHADRDGLTGVLRAVFIDRGGHAPGETCPTAKPIDPHFYMCVYPGDECTCHLYGHAASS
jgi:hypothetical protein